MRFHLADLCCCRKISRKRNIADIRRTLERVNSKIEIVESFYRAMSIRKLHSKEERPLAYISGKKVALLAGIADPGYFAWMVNNLGCEITDRFYYTDHYAYREEDMAFVSRKCAEHGVHIIITTEKDAVRLRRLKNMPRQAEIFALRVDSRINSNEERIINRLYSVFDR